MPSAVIKAQKLEAIRACIAAGGDAGACCLQHGVPRSTYYRWAAKAAAGGVAALENGKSTGRPSALVLTNDEEKALTAWCALMGEAAAGLRRWLEDSALPPERRAHPDMEPARTSIAPALRSLLAQRVSTWPVSLRRAAVVPAHVEDHLRGGHQTLRTRPSARRAMIFVDEDGDIRQVLPGHIFSSDDMSHNEPHRYYSAELGRETAGRQALITGDLYSHGLLTESLIGRRKDAYRICDIARHIFDTVSLYGCPLMWRFERGVWDNNFLYGVKPKRHWLLPDDTIFGAVDGVLFHCRQKHSPRGKGEIENAFRLYQKHLLHRGTSIGRIRGEYQITTRLYRQAVEGNPEALRAFWTIVEARAAHEAALTAYNTTQQIRRALGNIPASPAELWQNPQTSPLPAAERWRLLPWKACGAVRAGVYECKPDFSPVSLRFLVTGTPGCPVLDHGHRVFAAFDPARPQDGCHLFNAEPREGRSIEHGRRSNAHGFSLMEPLGVAAWWQDVPQENLSAVAGEYGPQKRAAAALRGEFTAAFPAGPSRALVRRSSASDAWGRAAAQGLPIGQPESAPPPPQPREPAAEPPPARRSEPPPDLVSLYRRALPAREAALSTAGE